MFNRNKKENANISPAVFAVKEEYQIMVPVSASSMMWVKVGGKCYYDDSNGIMCSLSEIHRMCVPKDELDKAGKYTICERKIIKRSPYFPTTMPVTETTYKFTPVKDGNVRAFFLSDAHNEEIMTVKAAKTFGKIDFLILGGDIPNHSGAPKNFNTIYRLCSEITHGEIPVIFARGNHDLRGLYAEKIADYTPNSNGKTYFTFRLGNIWGIVLDCGEDKDDTNAEYGKTICCHAFREKETDFIEDVVRNAENEYLAPGTVHRIVVAHTPFTRVFQAPFNIEKDIYSKWAELLSKNVKPELMLCGHTHEFEIWQKHGKYDDLGQPCDIVTCTEKKQGRFAGAGFEFTDSGINVFKCAFDGSPEKVYSVKL